LIEHDLFRATGVHLRGSCSRGFDRLTPLPEILAALERVSTPVAPECLPVEQAAGRIAASAILAPSVIPGGKIALRDGWAVVAQTTEGASAHAPCLVMDMPRRVAYGEAMPEGTDAILPLHGLRAARPVEILCAAAPGDFVRARGGDLAEGGMIAAAGEKLRLDQVALMLLAGIETVPIRAPRVKILARRANDPAACFLAAAAMKDGAWAKVEAAEVDDPEAMAAHLRDREAALVLALGDCGPGGALVEALRRAGTVLSHGIAVRPGEEIGCGSLPAGEGEARLAVLVPERFEGALAAWLLLALPCLRRMAGSNSLEPSETLPLTRKIISNPGWSDLVFLRRTRDAGLSPMWEPLAGGDIPWRSIARADAFLVVPPENEGHAAGESVFARSL
jgi:molybdopterin biosynthesis enzyme